MIIYRINWTNNENVAMEILMQDLSTVIGPIDDVIYVDQVGMGARLETLREEDPFAPIKAQRLVFSFRNTGNVNMELFSTGDNNRFLTQMRYAGGARIVFEGYLVMDDITEPYLDPGQRITLTATDNLGLLKNIDLVDFDGNLPRGKFKIIEFIAWCLNKTGLPRDIKICDNLFEDDHVDRDAAAINGPYHQTYIDALTFEKDINVTEDCYTVLEKILSSRKARLAYYNAEWWVQRIDEFKNNAFSYTKYASDASASNGTIDINLNKVVGKEGFEKPFFITGQNMVRMRRPFGTNEVQFPYEFPKELICNINFERGNFISTMSDEVIDSITYQVRKYELECWEKVRVKNDTGVEDTTISFDNYIKRYFFDNYEKQRFVVVTPITSGITTHIEYIKSEGIPVCKTSKFNFNFDFRFPTDFSFDGFQEVLCYISLNGDDASTWFLGNTAENGSGEWLWSDLAITSFPSTYVLRYDSTSFFNVDIDKTQWQRATINAPKIPVSGIIFIRLASLKQQTSSIYNSDIYYSNLQFNYKPFVNGGYEEFNGESFKISQPGNLSKKDIDEIALADAPCKPFKGAYFVKDGSEYFLTDKWNDWQLKHEDPTSGLGDERIAKWIAYSIWNQYRISARIFEVSFKGLQSNINAHCGLIHKYFNNVTSVHNNNRRFMLLHFEQDWYTCEWSALVVQIDDTTNQRSFKDNFEFKYLRENNFG